MWSGLMPPPLSTHAVSEAHGPPALEVVRSVPPTGHNVAVVRGPWEFLGGPAWNCRPTATKKFCPCAAIFWK